MKTEKPDFESAGMHEAVDYIKIYKEGNTFDFRRGYFTAGEKIWTDYVEPLQKELEEAKELLKTCLEDRMLKPSLRESIESFLKDK